MVVFTGMSLLRSVELSSRSAVTDSHAVLRSAETEMSHRSAAQVASGSTAKIGDLPLDLVSKMLYDDGADGADGAE